MTTSVSTVYHLISAADSCTPARNTDEVLTEIRLKHRLFSHLNPLLMILPALK
jgi:hypothetical protein